MDRLVATTCAVIAIAVPVCLAQTGQNSENTSRPAPVQANGTLLVLNNGRVVGGIITARPGGYDIRKPVGTLFISSTTVWFEAEDMNDAYRKMRGTFRQFTPQVHIDIARWCIANKQVSAARQELLDALHLEPRNDTARIMLKRLEANAVPKAKPVDSRTVAQRRADHFMQSEHKSLGGLTARQAATFVSRVQPILERRCGNSSCHGSASPTEFILKRSRGHSSQLVSQRNLAVVLKQIDFTEPANSPVLRVFDEPHTRDGRPLMSGQSGTIQRKIIMDWVHSVAKKEGSTQVATAGHSAAMKSRAPTAGSPGKSGIKSESDSRPTGATRTLTADEQKLIDEVRSSNEDDPFDPAEFNRKHHGFQKTARQQSNR